MTRIPNEIVLDGRARTDLRRRLLHALAEAPGAGAAAPFARAGDDPHEWIVALCDAWAFVAGGIRFYDERVLNEAFLDSASDADAIARLYRSLGHPVPPLVTASTYVSYTVSERVAGAERAARNRRSGTGASPEHRDRLRAGAAPEPAGTRTFLKRHSRIKGLPAAGRPGGSFVTLEDLDAFAGASEVRAFAGQTRSVAPLLGSTTQLELDGTMTGLVTGDLIAISGSDRRSGSRRAWVRRLSVVVADPRRGSTRVAWDRALDEDAGDAELVADAALHGFSLSSALFGATARPWGAVPVQRRLDVIAATQGAAAVGGGVLCSRDEGRGWRHSDPPLPPGSVPVSTALVAGRLLVATESHGVYVASGREMKPATGIPSRSVLFVGGVPGRLLASGAGAVWQSLDDGRTWDQVTGGPPELERPRRHWWDPLVKPVEAAASKAVKAVKEVVPKAVTSTAAALEKKEGPLLKRLSAGHRKTTRVVLKRLPRAAVRSVVEHRGALVAATDEGMYAFDGTDWRFDGLDEPVTALLDTPVHGLVAGTARGLYGRPPRPGPWLRLLGTFRPRVRALAWSDGLLVATDDGVWRLHSGAWTNAAEPDARLPRGAVDALAVVGPAVVAAPAAGGLYRSEDGGRTWAAAGDVVVASVPPELVEVTGGRGVTVPEPLHAFFDSVGLPLPPDATYRSDGDAAEIEAGPRRLRVVASEDAAEVRLGGAIERVSSLYSDGSTLVATAGETKVLATEWPGFGVSGRVVELAGDAPGARREAEMILTSAPDAGDAFVTQVAAAVRKPEERYDVRGAATSVTLRRSAPAAVYDRRTTTAWTGARPLPAFAAPAGAVPRIEGTDLRLAGPVPPGIGPGRKGVIAGRAVSVAVAPCGGVQRIRGRSVEDVLPQADVRDLAIGGDGSLFVAASEGLLVVAPGGSPASLGGSEGGGPRAVITRGKELTGVLVATADGIVRATSEGAWETAALEGHDVVALAPDGAEGAVAATADGGVFAAARGDDWTTLPRLDAPARALAARGGTVAAVTEEGVLALRSGAWAPAGRGLFGAVVWGLVIAGDGILWAAGGHGLAHLSAGDSSWYVDPAFEDRAVTALGLDGAGVPVAAGADALYRRDAAAGWRRVSAGPGGRVSAVGGDLRGTLWCGRSTAVPVVPRAGATGGAEVSSSLLTVTGRLTEADLKTLDAGAMPQALLEALDGAGEKPDPASLVVTGARPRCWVVASIEGVYVVAARAGFPDPLVALYRAGGTAVAATPRRVPGGARWQVDTGEGGGSLTVGERDFVVQPASSEGPSYAEPFVVARIADGPAGERSLLELASPLAHVYDAATATVHLNVVVAAQGRMVTKALGHGDPGRDNQTFSIPTPVASVVPPEGGVPASSLEVTVDGAAWTEVPTLAEAGPDARVYQVEWSPAGRAAVRFGDGVRGARLPRGHGNVVATYLEGGDAEAAPADIVQPLSRPALVTGVKNPLAALRPVQPDPERARRAGVRRLRRIVSTQDARDFAAVQPGVASVAVETLSTRAGAELVVTVSPAPGAPADLVARVERALADVRGPGPQLTVLPAVVVPVEVDLEVVAPPGTEELVRAELAGTAGDGPGAPLSAAEVLEAAAAIPGVTGARILSWARPGEPLHARASISCRGARPGAKPRAAEILTIDGARLDVACVPPEGGAG